VSFGDLPGQSTLRCNREYSDELGFTTTYMQGISFTIASTTLDQLASTSQVPDDGLHDQSTFLGKRRNVSQTTLSETCGYTTLVVGPSVGHRT
jgi:hypothetical protein